MCRVRKCPPPLHNRLKLKPGVTEAELDGLLRSQIVLQPVQELMKYQLIKSDDDNFRWAGCQAALNAVLNAQLHAIKQGPDQLPCGCARPLDRVVLLAPWDVLCLVKCSFGAQTAWLTVSAYGLQPFTHELLALICPAAWRLLQPDRHPCRQADGRPLPQTAHHGLYRAAG